MSVNIGKIYKTLLLFISSLLESVCELSVHAEHIVMKLKFGIFSFSVSLYCFIHHLSLCVSRTWLIKFAFAFLCFTMPGPYKAMHGMA